MKYSPQCPAVESILHLRHQERNHGGRQEEKSRVEQRQPVIAHFGEQTEEHHAHPPPLSPPLLHLSVGGAVVGRAPTPRWEEGEGDVPQTFPSAA